MDLCQWANAADDTMPIEYEPTGKTINARYANGVKLVIDCLETPFGQRPGWVQSLGTCPVRFVGEEGWVETGDNGGIEVQPASLKAEVLKAASKRQNGLDVASHTRNFLDCVRSRGKPAANSQVMRHSHIACHAAALSWILKRKLKFDPVKEEFVGDDEANGLRCRACGPPGSYDSLVLPFAPRKWRYFAERKATITYRKPRSIHEHPFQRPLP